jgi:hypothetical protein
MYHTPLTWYEQENKRYQAQFGRVPIALIFCVYPRWKLDDQRRCMSVRTAHTRSQTYLISALQIALQRRNASSTNITVTKGIQYDTAFLLLARVIHSA